MKGGRFGGRFEERVCTCALRPVAHTIRTPRERRVLSHHKCASIARRALGETYLQEGHQSAPVAAREAGAQMDGGRLVEQVTRVAVRRDTS